MVRLEYHALFYARIYSAYFPYTGYLSHMVYPVVRRGVQTGPSYQSFIAQHYVIDVWS